MIERSQCLAVLGGFSLTVAIMMGVHLSKAEREASPSSKVVIIEKPETPKAHIPALLEDLRHADVDRQMQAAEQLASQSSIQLSLVCEQLLADETPPDDAALNAALICWAKRDGEAALAWAWEHYQGPRFWSVLRNIGPACAWHHPDMPAGWRAKRT